MTKTMRGFTVVEFLIVVIVIGILATATIAVFRGVQDRGQTAQVIDGTNRH